MGRLTLTSFDKDQDRREFSIPTADTGVASTDPYNTLATPYSTLRNATEALMLTRISREIISPTTIDTLVDPSTLGNFAQNNITWSVQFAVAGMNGGPYTIRIPGADLNQGIVRNGRIELDLSTGVGQTFKTAFEAIYFWPGTLDNPAASGAGEATVQVVYATQS